MGRPGLGKHRKFARLARLLDSPALARGSLELIWDAAYENGDELLGSGEDVEFIAAWKGEPGILLNALLESQFVDLNGSGYRVHDLWDHAPDYVRKRMTREMERREKGVTISELRAKAGRASGEARREHKATDGEQVANKRRTHVEQTDALPALALKDQDQNHPPTKRRRRAEYPEEFEAFWKQYPRPVYKQAALEAWRSALKDPDATVERIIRSAKGYAETCEERGTDDRHTLHPETFLHKGRWKEYCFREESNA
jgi:hypothetical protein